MDNRLQVRRATPEDIYRIAPRLREADKKEMDIALDEPGNYTTALMDGMLSTDGCYVAVTDQNVPEVVFGTHPTDDDDIGLVWMMATDNLRLYRKQLIQETDMTLHFINPGYSVLMNYVYSGNRAHVVWLQRSGFSILRGINYKGHRFYEFARLMEGTGK